MAKCAPLYLYISDDKPPVIVETWYLASLPVALALPGFGALAVHKTPGTTSGDKAWTVTHVASGRRVSQGRTRTVAMDWATSKLMALRSPADAVHRVGLQAAAFERQLAALGLTQPNLEVSHAH